MANATATFIGRRGGTDYRAEGVDIMLSSTLSMAVKDPQSQKFQNMIHWDPDLFIDDGSANGTPVQPGDFITDIVDDNGRAWFANQGRIPLMLPRIAPGFGLEVAMAYIMVVAGQ